jgi:hypothetical protein
VDRLAILNAAHPRRLSLGLHTPRQLRKSWYFFFFQPPELPEVLVRADRWRFFQHFLRDASPAYSPEEIDRYVDAWSQPGAATAMIDYYRAEVRESSKDAEAQLRPISAPTLVIWGEQDRYLGPELAEPDRDDVPNLDRFERLPNASHWVHRDEAALVTQLLIDFFAPARSTGVSGTSWPSGRLARRFWQRPGRRELMASFDYDVVIIGSGFGGSVAALRAAEKGYRVGVMESGRRWKDEAELYGIQRIEPLDDVLVLSGTGVGGRSHVHANTLYGAHTAAGQHAAFGAGGNDNVRRTFR